MNRTLCFGRCTQGSSGLQTKDKAVQKMITLTKDNLTLATAVEIADVSVRAELDAAQLRWSSQQETTQTVTCKKQHTPCYRCEDIIPSSVDS